MAKKSVPKKRGRQPATDEQKYADNVRRLLSSLLPHIMSTETSPVPELVFAVQRDTRTGPYNNEQGRQVIAVLSDHFAAFASIYARGETGNLPDEAEWWFNVIDDGSGIQVQVKVDTWKPGTVVVANALKTPDCEIYRRRAKGGTEFWVVITWHLNEETEV